MKILSCSLAVISFVLHTIKDHHAYPYLNLNQTQLSRSTPITYDSFTDQPSTTSNTRKEIPIYNPFIYSKSSSTTQKEHLMYDPFTDKSSTSTTYRETLAYDPFTDKWTPGTPYKETLVHKHSSDKATTSTSFKEIFTYSFFDEKSTTSPPLNQKHRNRYNFRHRFRNLVITASSVLTTPHQMSQKLPSAEKTAPEFKSNDIYNKVLKDYAFIETPLNSTPMFHLNITLPKILLEGRVPRLASPYIIRVTLARKFAPRSNTTLPSRGFLRIVGSKVNMLEDGNLGMILGKIANQIGNAYNMTNKDIQGMRHVIVVGPGGQMVNRRVTPPKKTTKLTSPVMMTARLRLRLNCTLPKITDRVIYFEEYTKYFELY